MEYVVTNQKKVRKEMEEEQYALIDALPQFVWVIRPDGSIAYTNQRWRDYRHMLPQTGSLSEQEVWLQNLHPEDRERVLELRRQALATGEPYEFEYRLRDGRTGVYRWFLNRAMPVCDEAGQIVKWVATCTDIDEQKRTEEALRQSQERVNVLMNSSIIGINIIEGEQVVEANDTFLRMTGYTRDDLCEGRMNWLYMTSPEYLARAQQAHEEFAARQAMTYEKEYVCKDGSRLPVLVCGVVLKHHPFQGIAFVLDNSARKELEQRKDAFLGMVSHELKTPLASLKLQTQLLCKKLEKRDLPNMEVVCARVETQLNAITRLVDELIDLSRIQAGKLEYAQDTVDLGEMLEEVVDMIQDMHTTHTIAIHHASSPAVVVGDRDRLARVFLSVLSNAIKYAPDAPLIDVALTTSLEAVTISMRDQGIGIPRELQGRIFERFVLSGEMALNILQTDVPALLLLDYHLPGMNGLALADWLGSREEYDHIPILLMSADVPQEVSGYKHLRTLQKPFELAILLHLVAELLT